MSFNNISKTNVLIFFFHEGFRGKILKMNNFKMTKLIKKVLSWIHKNTLKTMLKDSYRLIKHF
jgi:hypothetical protein